MNAGLPKRPRKDRHAQDEDQEDRCQAVQDHLAPARVRRPKQGANHGMQEKSRKRVRRLVKSDMVDKTFEKHVKRMLPYGLNGRI